MARSEEVMPMRRSEVNKSRVLRCRASPRLIELLELVCPSMISAEGDEKGWIERRK